MRSYYINYPRNFANEYTVYAVPHAEARRFEAAFPSVEKITRAKAIERGIRRPAEARRDGEQWFGGLCNGLADTANGTTAERLDAAERNTLAEMRDVEGNRELTATEEIE